MERNSTKTVALKDLESQGGRKGILEMSKKRNYKLSVGSATDYEDLIAEITFEDKAGIIISQEKGQGIFEVSFHSFSSTAGEDFDFSKNIPELKISLEDVKSAIDEAVRELVRLRRITS